MGVVEEFGVVKDLVCRDVVGNGVLEYNPFAFRPTESELLHSFYIRGIQYDCQAFSPNSSGHSFFIFSSWQVVSTQEPLLSTV